MGINVLKHGDQIIEMRGLVVAIRSPLLFFKLHGELKATCSNSVGIKIKKRLLTEEVTEEYRSHSGDNLRQEECMLLG